MTHKKPERFSSDTPAELVRAIKAIAPLVDSDEKPDHIPMSTAVDGTAINLHDALNVVQHACPKAEWVIRARVRWIEHALSDWQTILEEMVHQDSIGKIASPDTDGGRQTREYNTLTWETIDHFITPGYVRGDCNRLLDRFFDLMATVILHVEDNSYYVQRLVDAIKQRSDCWHPGDPHRDERICHLMLIEYFGNEEGTELFQKHVVNKKRRR